MDNDYKTAISLLKQGQAPGNREILNQITVGIQPLTDFITQKYLLEYISQGGSKIKFVTGKTGSGKTHFLQSIASRAGELGFVTANFSAKDIWIHDFRDVYSEIFKSSNLMRCLERCAKQIISELGHDPSEVSGDISFVDYLSGIGELDALTKKEIRNQLQEMFLKNPLIDNNFAIACSLLTGSILGHPTLEASNRELLMQWLSGSKDIRLPSIRSLGLSPTKITKYNARHMLRSLAEVLRLASYPGILVTIDNADILVSSGAMDTIRYTKLKREDAYESIRELIDEIDSLKNVVFMYSFDKKLIDDELSGLKSYQALWMRIQNEIISNKFNLFTDIIDLDKYAEETFTVETVLEMSRKMADVICEAVPIDESQAAEIISKARFTKTSLPRQVGFVTMKGGEPVNTESDD